MFEFIESVFRSPAGSFGFVFGVLCLCFLVVWKISHFMTKFSSIEKLESSIDTIKEDMQYIKGFIQLFKETNNPLAKRQSPVSLTEAGVSVSKELDIEQMVIKRWDKIKSDVFKQLKNDCKPYDIQVESFKIGDKYQKYITDYELDLIKDHAFRAGFNLDVYNLLFGIIIRDKILTDKGHKSSDVDLYDPLKNKSKI